MGCEHDGGRERHSAHMAVQLSSYNSQAMQAVHARMHNASDKLTAKMRSICVGNIIYEGTERRARHETTAITTMGRTDDNAAAGTNGTR